ncbi:hypothetical protein BCM02_10779 [Paenibacillus methanolicus]|uniref:Uncharacterized protein n=1 Tax=Paenibacillus methanolicus TaxID=582686 RepID=A0A5S5C0Y4_9BACL|nr:hypothetical protein BCM02_10779 [Paenibacillus methanolicus]
MRHSSGMEYGDSAGERSGERRGVDSYYDREERMKQGDGRGYKPTLPCDRSRFIFLVNLS